MPSGTIKKFLFACILILCGQTVGLSQDFGNIDESAKKFEAVYENLKTKPKWLFTKDICPLELIPKQKADSKYSYTKCAIDSEKCLQRCRENNGTACYWLAVQIQEKKEILQDYSEALFLRACKFGVPSGCTNRAAAIFRVKTDDPTSVKCAVDTFEKTCEFDDPWGCTMFGLALFQGISREPDFEKALQVLSKSCKYGDEDPACQRAREIIEKIKKSERNKQKG